MLQREMNNLYRPSFVTDLLGEIFPDSDELQIRCIDHGIGQIDRRIRRERDAGEIFDELITGKDVDGSFLTE